jgi:hypothetical protein
LQTGIWEHVRTRLEALDPPIDDGANLHNSAGSPAFRKNAS